jgi:shikimate dehydrogenase
MTLRRPELSAISAATRVVGVIGSPVRHSLSPALHNAAFAAAGRDWRMLAFEVAPGEGAVAVSAMRTLGIAGLAVTMPHKADVATAVDELDAAAAALRSVNTVVLRQDGTTLGASTDGDGFVDSLTAAGYDVAGRRVVVLGAGGAARSIVVALGAARATDIAIVNRTIATAEEAAALAPQARVGPINEVAAADLLVNTTPVGMGSDELPLDEGLLHAGLTVADIVYHPLETALLRAAGRAGCDVVDGLGMLAHQAARQHYLWTGQRPDPAVLRAAAESELAARAR